MSAMLARVSGRAVFKSERVFRLWHYTATRNQLLLRSLPGDGYQTRVDLWFASVKEVRLPVRMPKVTIEEDAALFRLSGDGWSGVVEAKQFAFEEDDGAYDDPSPLFEDGLWHDLVSVYDAEPCSYEGVPRGVPLLTSSGKPFGTLQEVLEIPEEDLFDRLVVKTDVGERFVDADQVQEITTRHIKCNIDDVQWVNLPKPSHVPSFRANALQDEGNTLRDWVGRTFRRRKWKLDK